MCARALDHRHHDRRPHGNCCGTSISSPNESSLRRLPPGGLQPGDRRRQRQSRSSATGKKAPTTRRCSTRSLSAYSSSALLDAATLRSWSSTWSWDCTGLSSPKASASPADATLISGRCSNPESQCRLFRGHGNPGRCHALARLQPPFSPARATRQGCRPDPGACSQSGARVPLSQVHRSLLEEAIAAKLGASRQCRRVQPFRTTLAPG